MKSFFTLMTACLLPTFFLSAHCQMPCGIYHDDVVFDWGDQFVETAFKGMTVMIDSSFTTPKEKATFVRWVLNKEKESDDLANLLTTYFLQQKIKPGEQDTPKKLEALHKLLFLLVSIKQNVDIAIVEQFASEWDQFKLLFHRQGYECEMEKVKLKKLQEARDKAKAGDHPHGDHDANPSNVTEKRSAIKPS